MPRSYQLHAFPVTIFAHLLFIAVTTLVFIWLLRFRGGFAFNSPSKPKLINVFYFICYNPTVITSSLFYMYACFLQSLSLSLSLQFHTLLMMIGFVLVGGEAIIVHKALEAKRRSLKVAHMLLHLIALASGILGVITVYKEEVHLHYHIYTLHSWFGMIAICSFVLVGVLHIFFPGAEMSRRASMKPWHRLMGMVIFLLAVCTAETGLVQRFQYLKLGRSQEGLVLNFSALLLFLFAVTVGLSVTLPADY
ncbi:probable ascorbate-specific transmembrane electron transporter 1 [Neltuma alba]|uniref:probable ascorbate-specific transmembrane electron transporter 1 n=1 Tax=Neltuma alba TaxID=207710 RepID=UPI0010A444A4|nr:probable ascorbate-specific transmembrane electron transporter 1 [Prosopis alba]